MNKNEIKATVYRSSQRVFDCKLHTDSRLVQATALANLLKDGEVVVGDQVLLEEQKDQEFLIREILPRRNEVFRIQVREQKKRVTASNIDYLAIIASVSRPQFKRGILDRYLLRAYQWGIKPLVIFNKMDEFDSLEHNFDLIFEEKRLSLLGVDCFEISAVDENYRPRFLQKGKSELKQKIVRHTVLFQGQSGVGKSRLISALTGEEIQLKSQEIGKVGKGTHTTTWSEMIDCQEFTFIDSPGIRSFSVEDITKEELISYFPDVQDLALLCKFSNCTHQKNASGCAFHAKIKTNITDNENVVFEDDADAKKIILSRLESYLDILEEVSKTPSWANNFKDNRRK